jgi:hypothetical protein
MDLPNSRPGRYSQLALFCPACGKRFHLTAFLKMHYKREHMT